MKKIQYIKPEIMAKGVIMESLLETTSLPVGGGSDDEIGDGEFLGNKKDGFWDDED